MPAVYTLTVYSQAGHEDDVARSFADLAADLKGKDGYKGGHTLQGVAPLAPPPPGMTSEHSAEPEGAHGPTEGTHFIAIEIWESEEQRKAHRDTEYMKAWTKDFIPHIQMSHTHGWYKDITPH
jgi:heme-degrading monooxygenase HmoA